MLSQQGVALFERLRRCGLAEGSVSLRVGPGLFLFLWSAEADVELSANMFACVLPFSSA